MFCKLTKGILNRSKRPEKVKTANTVLTKYLDVNCQLNSIYSLVNTKHQYLRIWHCAQ